MKMAGPTPEERPDPNDAGRLRRLFDEGRGFAFHVLQRFGDDRCHRVAGELSYTTLLSLVPLLAVGLAMLTAFPVFAGMREQIQDFVFANFVPAAGDVVQKQFTSFLDNAGKLTIFGIIALGVTALLLLNTIEAAFNAIWREKRARPIIIRFLTYWAILTLGPLLIGSSIALSSYIFTLTRLVGIEAFTGPLGGLVRLLPFALLVLGLMALYVIMPARPARWRPALAGAVVAALLFEVLKRLFALYVAEFPSYEALYGALAALPLFLVWMYLAWGVVLFGAEVAASIPEWRALRRQRPAPPELSAPARLSLALDALGLLRRAIRDGRRRGGGKLSDAALARDTAVDVDALAPLLATLAAGGFVAHTTDNRWLLARDLDAATLYDLCQALGFGLTIDEGAAYSGSWPPRVAQALASADAASRDHMGIRLSELVEEKP
jgi:membrane protein